MNERQELWRWLEKNAVYKPLPHLSGPQNLARRHAELRLLREVKAILEKYPMPRSRNTDPRTSKQAGKSVKAGSQRYRLLTVYSKYKQGVTAEEAAAELDWLDSGICYWKRVSELVHDGLLEDTGTTRKSRMGQKQRVCRITQRGKDAIE